MRDVAVSSNHSEAVNSVKREQSSYLRKNAFKDWHKDLTCKAKAKAKDLSFKAKAKAKDLTFKAKAKAKDLSSKAKAKAKDMKIVLKDSLRTRPRPRTNITVI